MGQPSPHFFLAVPLPAHVREILERQAGQLRAKLPYKVWPHPQDYHITLVFLGAAGFQKVNEIKQRVAQTAKCCSSFTATLNGLGTFGKRKQPRVLWAGVSAGEELYDLQNKVAGACRSAGFETDARPYKPHITLAKTWAGTEVLDEKIFLSGPESVSWKVEEMALYQTHLRRNPKYQPLKIFPLFDDE
ncbi:MAG TPA: RNA 2',3'-cyclic phosphodiesterase [Bacillales bacterium]|nr:RNA 2',3'-cyclic phosphodiesterase [Bacillales bacterium]